MNIDTLLTPISAESPCGENLEYDDEFLALERILIEKPEQQFGDILIPATAPNWVAVEKNAIHLLTRSKDLRIIIALMQAWLNIRGLCGYADGLNLLRQTLERYWEEVWPRLEFDDEYDPLFRLNTLAAIEDGSPCTTKAQAAIILKSVSQEVSLQEACSLLNGTITEIKGYIGGRNRLLNELKQQSDSPEIIAITTARDHLIALTEITHHNLPDNYAPELPKFLKQLDTIIEHCPVHKPKADLQEESANIETLEPTLLLKHQAPTEQTNLPSSTTEISERIPPSSWYEYKVNNRDEARILLEKAKTYFLQHEPSHPAPMMIDRILRLIDRDFMNIIYDLVPEGLNQLDIIFGHQNNSNNPDNSEFNRD
ncbi:type VI secretion system protein TssA [Xenorhabdus hominickii]|uniref:ImpA N-terminal domain-containing protein n=1 Tax=Xenorhabdus hominickii TaxID=351679 RepID=A0A2G0Q211_XENHO|nr:type VI secretion system protein TssA [Xenorhabdus hominickii]AOM40245.1 hypothetical protein A9255_06430 [Xenorhabdus hominickii]PHM53246.1 hypothetical protein Xhom_04141 [Xenorhabdus hominickii]